MNIEGKGLISIWFFIGVLLLVYGIIILAPAFITRSIRRRIRWCWPNFTPRSGGALSSC